MVRITEELLRKRAEHNEGELWTLKEVTLHQFGKNSSGEISHP